MSKIRVKVSDLTKTETGVENGIDAIFEFEGYGLSIVGEVTLIKNKLGYWSAWGDPDHWVSGEALNQLMILPDKKFTEVLNAIEAAAAEAIEKIADELGY
jgi:hypothetical protein